MYMCVHVLYAFKDQTNGIILSYFLSFFIFLQEQMQEVLDAMFEKRVSTQCHTVNVHTAYNVLNPHSDDTVIRMSSYLVMVLHLCRLFLY